MIRIVVMEARKKQKQRQYEKTIAWLSLYLISAPYPSSSPRMRNLNTSIPSTFKGMKQIPYIASPPCQPPPSSLLPGREGKSLRSRNK